MYQQLFTLVNLTMKHQKTSNPSVKVNSQTTECPACKSSWDGGFIFDTFCQQRAEGYPMWADKTDAEIMDYVKEAYPAPYIWHRQIAIEITEEYDGVSIWQCPDCKAQWDAFTGERMGNQSTSA